MTRTISLVYLAFLTVLLIVRNPLYWFQAAELESAFQLVGFIAHFVTFSILGWLMLQARWPLAPLALFALLVLYAGATELIQSPIPNRSPEWLDFAQDVAGLALGMTLCWVWQRVWTRSHLPIEVAAATGQD